MSTTASSGNIRVTVNGIPSVCLNDCSYNFLTDVPEVSACTLATSSLNIELTDPANINVPLTEISV